MSRTTPTLLVAALLLPAAPAAAATPDEEGAWAASMAVRTRYVRSGSLDPLSDNDAVPALDLSIGRRVTGGLTASLGWSFGGLDERRVFGVWDLGLERHEAVVALDYEQPVWRNWLRALVRAEGAFVASRLGLDMVDGSGELSQWAYGGRFMLAGGGRFAPLSNVRGGDADAGHAGFTFALDVLLGYSATSDLVFDDLRREEPEDEPDPAPIDTLPLRLGNLAMDGLELRVGATMKF